MPQSVSILQPVLWESITSAPHEECEKLVGITLITGHRSDIYQRMRAWIVELALAGPVKVLIGGNRYDHYRINYTLAAETPFYEYILDHHIRLSRAETCYQMVELLSQVRADTVPTLILDLLTTFYDKSVPKREIDQMLFEAILQLRRLSRRAAVVVSAQAEEKRPQLLKVIENSVDRVEGPPVPLSQPICQPVLIG